MTSRDEEMAEFHAVMDLLSDAPVDTPEFDDMEPGDFESAFEFCSKKENVEARLWEMLCGWDEFESEEPLFDDECLDDEERWPGV